MIIEGNQVAAAADNQGPAAKTAAGIQLKQQQQAQQTTEQQQTQQTTKWQQAQEGHETQNT